MEGITKDAIVKIQELVEGQEKTVKIDGKEYLRFNYSRVYSDPRPSNLGLSTLDGIADYINKNLDQVKDTECMIVIDSYDKVSIHSPVKGEKNDRHNIAVAEITDTDVFPFGQFIDQESFIISLSALFGNTDDKMKILKAVSNMQVIDQAAADDDGNTTARTVGNQVICPGIEQSEMPKAVVTLKPFRTFREVDQPESAFIFRYRKGRGGFPEIALFEADGGAWKIDAKAKIKEYLAEKVKTPIIC